MNKPQQKLIELTGEFLALSREDLQPIGQLISEELSKLDFSQKDDPYNDIVFKKFVNEVIKKHFQLFNNETKELVQSLLSILRIVECKLKR